MRNEGAVGDKQQKFLQQATGTFLYYSWVIDSTMLLALSALAMQQKQPTMVMMTKLNQFLNYAATHPDAVITYKKSDNQLVVNNNEGYLNECNARIRVGGHHFL